MIDVEAQLLFMSYVWLFSVGHGIDIYMPEFYPARVRQIRHNEMVSMGNILPCCSGTPFSLELQVLGLTL